VTGIDYGGVWDSANGKVKWGPFFDNQARTLSYVATPPQGETGSKTFVGAGSFDGGNIAITGDRVVSRGDGPQSFSFWVQVGANSSGMHGSQWKTDLGIFNPSSETANIEVIFYPGAGAVRRNTTYVAPGALSILGDVVSQLGATGSGAIEVRSTGEIRVTSRTFNAVSDGAVCTPGGTFGQFYPAYRSEDALQTGESAWLPHLVENSRFRTNLAITNTGSSTATVLVELFDGAGTRITGFQLSVGASLYRQEAQVFKNRGGRQNVDRGTARITVLSGSGVIASASLVDNITNDPTTIPMM
jgi:hypothetical protein